MADGWIKVHRKILNNELFNLTPFDKLHAFIDLLLQAGFGDRTVNVRGVIIPLNQGEVAISVRDMADRWGWTHKQARMFINLLIEQNCITVKTTSYATIIKISNWDKYQYGKYTISKNVLIGHNKGNSELEVLEVFLFRKYLKEPRLEMEKFLTYYEKTGWRTATGVKIMSRKSAAIMWTISGTPSTHNKALLDKYHKVYAISEESSRMQLIDGLISVEIVNHDGNNIVVIKCFQETYRILDTICREYSEKWQKIWQQMAVKFGIPKENNNEDDDK